MLSNSNDISDDFGNHPKRTKTDNHFFYYEDSDDVEWNVFFDELLSLTKDDYKNHFFFEFIRTATGTSEMVYDEQIQLLIKWFISQIELYKLGKLGAERYHRFQVL